MKELLNKGYNKVKSNFREHSTEILVGAALGVSLSVYGAYRFEENRTNRIPLGFSEISQIERDAQISNNPIGPVTSYLAFTNDATMKVFEAWNNSRELDSPLKDADYLFARELEAKSDRSLKHNRYGLQELLTSLPELSDKTKEVLATTFKAKKDISPTNDLFEKSWDDRHNDHYRTEVYMGTEIYTGADGKTHTRTVLKTRQVYDYTTHTYDYHKKEGESASKNLDTLLRNYPDISLKEKILLPSKTNAEGEYAADKSRGKETKERLSPEELLGISRTWYSGSTIRNNLSEAELVWGGLHGLAPKWRKNKDSAESARYNTHSHFDSGPKEFQTAESIKENGLRYAYAIDEIYSSITNTKEKSQKLSSTIDEFIAVALDKKEGSPKKLRKEIMQLSKDIYKSNFNKGFEVDRFRWEMLALFGLLGASIGAGLGFGADYVGRRFKLYEETENKSPSTS